MGNDDHQGPVTVRKLPVEHRAVRYTGHNCYEVALFTWGAEQAKAFENCECDGEQNWIIETLHGPVTAKPGDWIVKGDLDMWPVDPEQFRTTYEVVEQ